MERNKWNIAFLREIVIIFSTIYLFKVDCPKRFFFDVHPSTSKFLSQWFNKPNLKGKALALI